MVGSPVRLLQDAISLLFTLPFLFAVLSVAGIVIQRAAKRFQLPPTPSWPENENPNLASELVGSLAGAAKFLGPSDSEIGENNRDVLKALQYRDFAFIAVYVTFFVVNARAIGGWIGFAIGSLAVLTGILDVLEDHAILKLARVQEANPARFGVPKWFFYFLTLGLQSLLFKRWPTRSYQEGVAILTLLALIAASAWGMIASVRRSFSGISSATKLSAFGLLGLAIYSIPVPSSIPVSVIANYVMLERVPILFALVMVALAFIGKGPGLLDLTTPRIFFVSLAAAACGEAIASNARLIFQHAPDRIAGLAPIAIPRLGNPGDLLLSHSMLTITLAASLPVLFAALIFSARQRRNPLSMTVSMAAGLAVVIAGCHFARMHSGEIVSIFPRWLKSLGAFMASHEGVFHGYGPSLRAQGVDPRIIQDHLAMALGFAFTTLIYAALGFYGRWQLRRPHKKEGDYTVPALCSAIMILMWSCWILGALTFFFDAYRIPVLLILALAAVITSQSSLSDHFYALRPRTCDPAPSPAKVLQVTKFDPSESRRVIVAAANGGGIQAAAWAARVLAGLQSENSKFRDHLRMISSVSGGSVGSAMFLDQLSRCSWTNAPEAAAASSLDEVSWGLAWPDFLTGLFPWLFGVLFTIGRGRALEAAWVKNSGKDSGLEHVLDSWNGRVSRGELPAIIMNSTIVETGQRLLFGTTRLSNHGIATRARVDAADLHGSKEDVSIVTAARLSATFPYVTPASRADIPGPQPHMVDGGYYDNFGMATLVEWLDEALRDSDVEQVLVLQIHGVPVRTDFRDQLYTGARGWFFQALAPLLTLVQVRSAGQVAHNDVELGLLQESYARKGIAIHSLEFEFPNPDAPLSWHLTKTQRNDIEKAWNGESIKRQKDSVQEFLKEGRSLAGCTCPACTAPPPRTARA